MANKKTFWESFIVVMILAAVVQIFLEDFSRLGSWNVPIRKNLIIIGFLLDLIFTVEFIIRSILSRKAKGWLFYFKYEKGWVDFFSAVPLILFNSGPIMIGMFWPGALIALPFLGMLNILKITKILRIARILRLLRVLKIFKKSSKEDEESRTAQLNRIISISVVTIAIVLILSPLLPQIFYSADTNLETRKQKYHSILRDYDINIKKSRIKESYKKRAEYLKILLKENPDVLYMYYRGQEAINNLGEGSKPAKVIPKLYFYTDWDNVRIGFGSKLYYSVRDIIADNARISLLLETIIVILIISFLIFYSDPAIKK